MSAVPMTARYAYDFSDGAALEEGVAIEFGDTTVAFVDPADYGVGPSRAGHGDDSSYSESEQTRIVEETAAAWFKQHVLNPTPVPAPVPAPQAVVGSPQTSADGTVDVLVIEAGNDGTIIEVHRDHAQALDSLYAFVQQHWDNLIHGALPEDQLTAIDSYFNGSHHWYSLVVRRIF